MPARLRSEWDGWLQRGLALAAAASDKATLSERLRCFAPWCYLAWPSPGETWCGIMVPSQDRVGRAFPLTLLERTVDPASPQVIAARLASLLDAAADGPDALEAAIAAMPPPAREEVRPETRPVARPGAWLAEARSSQPASLWWPLAAPPEATPRKAAWPPEPALLVELLDLQSAAHQIASAE